MVSSSSSSLSAGGDCPPFEYDPHGRQGIGVAQPQSGIDYPLVRPPEEIRFLLADFQLNIDDPGLYGGTPFTPPYRLHWIYGVGCEGEDETCSESSVSSSSAGVDAAFCPQHAAEVTVVDRDDRVVFHSPDAADFSQRPWGDRLHIYEWRDDRLGACLLVVHTKWPAGQSDFTPRNYPKNFFPSDATLDERAVMRLPKRIRSLTVILDNFSQTPLEFSAGYNMQIATEAANNRGLRNVTQVRFNANPGSGLGIFPGCVPEPLVIRSINGTRPTDTGDFYMAASDCYWARQPTRVLSTDPRETLPQVSLLPGSMIDEDLPDPDAGTSKTADGWPPGDDPKYAHLQTGNDCNACCDCDDYVSVANYMNKIRDQYAVAGDDAENVRDLYHANIDRWLDAKKCLTRRPLRLALQPQFCPYLDVAIQFCNQQQVCLTDVVLTVGFETSPPGGIAVEVPGYTFITGASSKPGRRSGRTERYDMGGEWPEFQAFFDAVNPGQSVSARFRLHFANCGLYPASLSSSLSSGSLSFDVTNPGYAVTGNLSGTADGEDILVFFNPEDGSESSGSLVAADAEVSVTLNCPPGDDTILSELPCF